MAESQIKFVIHASSIFGKREICGNRPIVYPLSGEEASWSNCEEVRLLREMKLLRVTVKCQDCPSLQMGVQPIETHFKRNKPAVFYHINVALH